MSSELPEIRNPQGERLACTWVPADLDGRAVVVIGHGLTSDRERPWSAGLSRALAARGLASVRVAFSGNGDSEGRFVDSTISKEVADLGAVLDALETNGHEPVGYVGHSMGAAVGVLRGATDLRVRALVSLAGMVHTKEFVERMFGHLSPGEPMLDKPHCPFGEALRDDLRAIDTVVDRAGAIEVPWLLVHGTADDVVPVGHGRDMAAAAAERARLVELDDVDHSFTGPGLSAMIDVVAPWCARHLG